MYNVDNAISLYKNHYNCCQAVTTALAEYVGADKELLFKGGEGFGFGMGCSEGVCGALVGAIMIAGVKNSDGDMDNPKSKGVTAKIAKKLVAKFKENAGALICRDLKGLETGQMICSCENCIRFAVEAAEEILDL